MTQEVIDSQRKSAAASPAALQRHPYRAHNAGHAGSEAPPGIALLHRPCDDTQPHLSQWTKKSPQTFRQRANPIQEELEETGAL